jgi:hypothetical protein
MNSHLLLGQMAASVKDWQCEQRGVRSARLLIRKRDKDVATSALVSGKSAKLCMSSSPVEQFFDLQSLTWRKNR